MNEEQLDTIEENSVDVPQEVKDFIFSDNFEGIKAQILMNIVKEDEKLQFSNALMIFLLGGISAQELDYNVQGLSIDPAKKSIIRSLIQDKVVSELLLTIEVAEELDQEASATIALDNTTSQNAALENSIRSVPVTSSLTSLAERLKQSSMSSPTTRNYTLQKGTVPENLPITEPGVTASADTIQLPVSTASLHSNEVPVSMQKPVESIAPTHTIDPYHESIDNI